MLNNVELCILTSIMWQRRPMWDMSMEKRGLRFLQNFVTPIRCGYFPCMYVTGELREDEFQWYQEVIGTQKWALEIGRIYILLKVSFLSTQLALLCEGHLEEVFKIFGYLNIHKKMNLMFDCG